MWLGLADAVVGVHYAFMAYLVVGGFVAWRWRWTIVGHLAAAIWAVLIVVEHWECPLTSLQNWFRAQAGRPAVSGGFIDHYIQGVFYPAGSETAAQIVLGVVILASWIGYVVLGRRRRIARTSDRERVVASRSAVAQHR